MRPPSVLDCRENSAKEKSGTVHQRQYLPDIFPANDGRERRAKKNREKISIMNANLNHRSKLRCATSAIRLGAKSHGEENRLFRFVGAS